MVDRPEPAADTSDEAPLLEHLRARRELIRRLGVAAAVPAIIAIAAGAPRTADATPS
jgi:hypothetical protein